MSKTLKILLAVLFVAALPLGLLLTGMALPSYYQEAYYAELGEMYDRLYETKGKKLVIVGGSNVAFGLDGALLEELLAANGQNYTVCPFGLYAAVGTSAMLDLSADALGEGDVVVLSVEPGSQTMSTYFGATAFWKCTEEAPQMLLKMSGAKASALVGNYVPYLQERISIYLDGNPPVAEGVYARSSFNDRCDLIYERPGNIMSVGYDTAAPIDLSAVTIESDFARQVNDYCAKAKANGATVVMSFSPMNRSAMRNNTDQTVLAYFDLCNETFACPIISDPKDYILPSGWFYDNNFHLNDAGAQLRTQRLAEDLLAFLGCYVPQQYVEPTMPGTEVILPEAVPDKGEFLYQAVIGQDNKAEAYLVSGVAEEALDKTTLTVPERYEGLPVVGFTEDALATAARLEELWLPGSIESLPDNLFRNCKSLTRLMLAHTGNLCTVTAHTFDGADQLVIHVPEAVYALYRDGEGCATNSWYPYLHRIVTY